MKKLIFVSLLITGCASNTKSLDRFCGRTAEARKTQDYDLMAQAMLDRYPEDLKTKDNKIRQTISPKKYNELVGKINRDISECQKLNR